MTNKPAKKNRRRAWAWLVRRGIRQVDIQRELRHKHITQVNETLQGTRNDRRVLQYLFELGCPEEYLDLPTDIHKDAL